MTFISHAYLLAGNMVGTQERRCCLNPNISVLSPFEGCKECDKQLRFAEKTKGLQNGMSLLTHKALSFLDSW